MTGQPRHVEFSPQGSNPSFRIHDSWSIKDRELQAVILAHIMTDPLYTEFYHPNAMKRVHDKETGRITYVQSEASYDRTIEDLLEEWGQHNAAHCSITAITFDIFGATMNVSAANTDFDKYGGAGIVVGKVLQ